MEIKKKVEETINKQIKEELESGYLYLSMAAYFDSKNLSGFAHWMKVQAQEETKHAMKLYKYLVERAGRVILLEIKAPKGEWNNPLEAFKEAYAHELKITSLIYSMLKVVRAEEDAATESALKWFVDEQVEEEKSADEIVKKLEMIGDSHGALYHLDRQLGKRGA